MCRSIGTLYNFEPPVTAPETHAAALQFVRKLSGFAKPSKANQSAFDRAGGEIAASAARLLDALETQAAPRDRDLEAAKARARSVERSGKAGVEPGA